MHQYKRDPEAISSLTPEQYRVTQENGNSPGGGLAETETRSKLSYKGRLSWGGAGSSEGAGLPAR
jgi:hypothetical protein